MNDPHSSFEYQFDILRAEYAAQLQERTEQIERIWAALLCEPWDGVGCGELHLIAHRLASTGNSFGFTAVSEAARALEVRFKALPASPAMPTGPQQAQIRRHLDSLGQATAAAGKWLLNAAHAWPQRSQVAAPRRQGSTNQVFLLENAPALAQELTLQIGLSGYSVRTFSTIKQLQEAVQRDAPVAVIVDSLFPDDDQGSERAIAALQQLPQAPIPLIFISARDDLMARLRAVRAGGTAYFTLPVNISRLTDTLEALTTRHTAVPYRILVVDDSATLAAYYMLILEQAGMTTSVVNDPLRVIHELVEFQPDLILMDLYMPGCSGLELAKVIRQQEAYVGVPIVFLSGETSLDRQLAALSLGGDDFLTKPIQPNHLLAAVTSRVQRAQLLRSIMVRDSLTGLFNHTVTKEHLEREVARARRQQTPLVFAMLDIDHFKRVNDTYGHVSGDRVIKSLARLLQQRLRKTDIVGRYGGEEFAVILPDTDETQAVRVLDMIRADFEQLQHQSEDRVFTVTLSCGVAGVGQRSDPVSINDAADKALYDAKRGGRNQVVLAN